MDVPWSKIKQKNVQTQFTKLESVSKVIPGHSLSLVQLVRIAGKEPPSWLTSVIHHQEMSVGPLTTQLQVNPGD